MLVESKFSLNGSMEWWLHHPQPTKTTGAYKNECRLSAVLLFCNIYIRPTYRGNCSKELPAKIHLTVDKFKSFPLQFLSFICKSTAQQPRVPAVSDLCCICHSEPVVDVCSAFDPESQSTILFGRFIWLFCISMQLFLVAIKVPILYPTCKISVFSVAKSFSVNYFCYENLSIIIIEEIMISSTNQVFINYLSTIVFDFLSPKLPLAACNNCLTMWQVLYPLCCFSEKYCLWARILFSCWEIPQLSMC